MTKFASEFIAEQKKIFDNPELDISIWVAEACGNYYLALDYIEHLQARVQELEQERRWIHQDKTMIAKKDGDSWCFVLPDFVNLHESEAEFVDGILYRFIEEIYKRLVPPQDGE